MRLVQLYIHLGNTTTMMKTFNKEVQKQNDWAWLCSNQEVARYLRHDFGQHFHVQVILFFTISVAIIIRKLHTFKYSLIHVCIHDTYSSMFSGTKSERWANVQLTIMWGDSICELPHLG